MPLPINQPMTELRIVGDFDRLLTNCCRVFAFVLNDFDTVYASCPNCIRQQHSAIFSPNL